MKTVWHIERIENQNRYVLTAYESKFELRQIVETGAPPKPNDDVLALIEAAPHLAYASLYALDNLDSAQRENLIVAPKWFQAQLGESAKELRRSLAKAKFLCVSSEPCDMNDADWTCDARRCTE